MDEKMKEVKKDVLKGIKDSVGELFKESEKAVQASYRDRAGHEAYECPGAYCPRMTGLMARDAGQLALLVHATGKDAAAQACLKKVSETLEEKDLAVRRMADDRRDGRPVIPYPYGDTAALVEELARTSKDGGLSHPLFGDCTERAEQWAARLLKLDMFGYYLEAHDAIDRAVSDADMRAYDDDGEQVLGIDEKDAECVKTICAMEQLLLKALMRIPPQSGQVQPTLARLEVMHALVRAIVEEDGEMLERLEKAAEAARDFTGEDGDAPADDEGV